ncbi:MAG: phenylalanine--tRNA ligase subunit beta, partial [Saprospiraceae bacterium]
MTLSLQWLNDYLKTDLNPDQIAEALTSIGLEVEKIESSESMPGGLKGVIAGKVLTCEKHPDADRLKVTTVDIGGDKPSSIVCGGPNVAAGQTVWVAVPGTTLYDKDGNPRAINTSKIRGALSEGMICAEDELGLGESHEGVLVLSDDVKIGTLASDYYHVTSDTILEIGLTPNRSDATSVLGVAEDLAAYLTLQNDVEYKVQWPLIPEIKKA